jgi:hypothetical protein
MLTAWLVLRELEPVTVVSVLRASTSQEPPQDHAQLAQLSALSALDPSEPIVTRVLQGYPWGRLLVVAVGRVAIPRAWHVQVLLRASASHVLMDTTWVELSVYHVTQSARHVVVHLGHSVSSVQGVEYWELMEHVVRGRVWHAQGYRVPSVWVVRQGIISKVAVALIAI